MSKIKDLLMDEIEALAKLTGYKSDFLWDMWLEVMDDGGSWGHFVGVTLEMDW